MRGESHQARCAEIQRPCIRQHRSSSPTAALLALICAFHLVSCRDGWEPLAWIGHAPVDQRIAESRASPLTSRFIASAGDFSIVVISDLHATSSTWAGQAALLAWIDDYNTTVGATKKVLLCVATGDLTDGGLAAQYGAIASLDAALALFAVEFAPVPGNHELYTLQGWELWKRTLVQATAHAFYPAFGTIDIGPSASTPAFSIVLADSADGKFGAVQWPLIEKALAVRAGTHFAFASHMQLFLAGSSIHKLDSQAERLKLAGLLSQTGALAYFGGHDHSRGLVASGGVAYACCGMSGPNKNPRSLILIEVGSAGISWKFADY